MIKHFQSKQAKYSNFLHRNCCSDSN